MKNKLKKYWIILTTWEYWPWGLVYFPVYIYYLINLLKTGKWFYFSAVNPTMKNGGFFGNTKTEMYDLLPRDSYPKYSIHHGAEKINLDEIAKNISFPCILKPNVGERGFGIIKINSINELKAYHDSVNYEYLIQEFCDYENELSVFCIKNIHTNTFEISSIVGKKLLSIVGDGVSTVYQLILKDHRAFLQIERLKLKWESKFEHVLNKNEELVLIDNANHSKGASFYLIKENKTEIGNIFKNLSEKIKGFNYGRFDVKYDTIEELLADKYSIIELNGVGAEPINMYIPNLSLWKGLSILVYHWKKMYEIAAYNMKVQGIKPISKKEGFAILKKHKEYKGKDMW